MVRSLRRFGLFLLGLGTTWSAACGYFPQFPLGFSNNPATVLIPGGDAQVPFQLLGNYIVVDVTFGGAGPYRFILDTGAGVTILSPEVADTLPQNLVGSTNISSGLGPQSVNAPLIRVEQLGLGTMQFSMFQAAILPPLQFTVSGQTILIDGVLGMPLFRHLALTLDYPGRVVRVREGTLPAADQCLVLPIGRNNSQLPTLTLDVAGHSIEAILDTGYNDFLVVPEGGGNYPFLGPTSNTTATTVTGTFQITKGTLDGHVEVGCLSYQMPPVSVGGGIAALGAKAFLDFIITIDQASGRIRFQQ